MDLLTEKLWNEYFAEECSRLDTNEERELIKKAGKLHELMNETLSIEHRETMEEYIETSYAIQRLFTKKHSSKDANSLYLSCLNQKKRDYGKSLSQKHSPETEGVKSII